jgi:hypothetical protein
MLSLEDQYLMPEGEQFGFEGGAMTNGVADGHEKRDEDGSHAVECGATINRRKRREVSAPDGVFGRDTRSSPSE